MKIINKPFELALILLTCINLSTFAQSKTESKAIKNLQQAQQVAKRETAATILSHADNLEAAQALAHALVHDSDLTVRTAAAAALWGHSHAEYVEAALWQATEDVPEVAVRAAGALQILGISTHQLAPVFRQGLLASGTATRFNAARGLIGVDDPVVLVPHLLDYLQLQAGNNNPSGIKAVRDVLEKIFKPTEHKLQVTLLDKISGDQPGNHVVLQLFEASAVDFGLLEPHIKSAANSQFILNRMAAARLMSITLKVNQQSLNNTINQLFKDHSTAVVEAIARSCGMIQQLPDVCKLGLQNLLNSNQTNQRQLAADVLAGSMSQVETSLPQDSLTAQLAKRALNDSSDDVRYDAIKAYINASVSDSRKASLLVEVALQETQPYIITFALSRLNQFQQHLNSDQKDRLLSLKSHADSEVKRLANLMF